MCVWCVCAQECFWAARVWYSKHCMLRTIFCVHTLLIRYDSIWYLFSVIFVMKCSGISGIWWRRNVFRVWQAAKQAETSLPTKQDVIWQQISSIYSFILLEERERERQSGEKERGKKERKKEREWNEKKRIVHLSSTMQTLTHFTHTMFARCWFILFLVCRSLAMRAFGSKCLNMVRIEYERNRWGSNSTIIWIIWQIDCIEWMNRKIWNRNSMIWKKLKRWNH